MLQTPTEEMLQQVVDAFTVDMLDWAPRVKTPDGDDGDDGLDSASTSTSTTMSEASVKAGEDAMVSMISCCYDDVAVDACATVAKLAATYASSRLSLAASIPIMTALLDVVDGNLSLSTATNAALSLSELTTVPAGQLAFTSCDPTSLRRLLTQCEVRVVEESDGDFHLMCFRRYWCVCTTTPLRPPQTSFMNDCVCTRKYVHVIVDMFLRAVAQHCNGGECVRVSKRTRAGCGKRV